MWDWVGGRYSLWSCVGFSLALAIGMPKFSEMLKGAAEMDAHFLNSPIADNLPVRHALIGIWNRNAMGFLTQAIMPYDERLSYLPAYLQQLVMESLGKSVGPDNREAMQATVPVLWAARQQQPAQLFPGDAPRQRCRSDGLHRRDQAGDDYPESTGIYWRICWRRLKRLPMARSAVNFKKLPRQSAFQSVSARRAEPAYIGMLPRYTSTASTFNRSSGASSF